MKVSSQTRVLQEAVQLVSGVVPGNVTRPILACVLIRADEAGLTVQGTDLDVGLAVRVDEVNVGQAGAVAVAASRLHAILRETPSESVLIESSADGTQLTISAEGSTFKIPLDSPDEFPMLEFTPPSPAVTIDRETLLDCLRLTSIAAARDQTRFQMHSVLFDCRPDGIRFVSTDGKRMAIAETTLVMENRDGVRAQYIVPLKGVELLTRILSIEEGVSVALYLDQGQIIYNSDRVSLSCRLVEGKFPEYERALPAPGQITYEVPREEFGVALRQASLMTTKETNTVLFSFEGSRLVLSTKAASLGESRVEMEIDAVQAPSGVLSINFNPTYLLDLIKVLNVNTLQARFKDSKTAGSFESKQEKLSYRHILMPLVTTSE
ncbi:MAG: DNA polymerase III subunit beta [Planctomycetota bacterium]